MEDREEKRELFAALAMIALIIRGNTANGNVAIEAVNHAMALLEQLEQTAPPPAAPPELFGG